VLSYPSAKSLGNGGAPSSFVGKSVTTRLQRTILDVWFSGQPDAADREGFGPKTTTDRNGWMGLPRFSS
jgi:hypothetical protein